MTAGLHTVHLRVNDATGQPTPVRLRLTDATGNYYPPLGRLARFATGRGQDVGGNLLLGAKQYAYIDGACEVPLPAGPIRAELWKGPEYRPQTVETQLTAGKLALRLTVERWADLRDQGWYSGDTRAHYLSPAAALLEAAAEDLAVVNVLACEDVIRDRLGPAVPALPNILDFSGQRPALERPGHLVAVNTHNVHPVLGSLGLLNSHRAVYPLTFGGPDGADDWTMFAWCGQCHRKGGLVVWTRPWWEERTRSLFDLPCEPLADLVLGGVDAFEIGPDDSLFDVLSDWYDLLNCGFRVPLVGGSGKDGNGVPLGAMRTYARLPAGEALTYKGWVEAVRRGDTFVTNGPLLSLSSQRLDAGQRVAVRAEARGIVPFDHLELVAGGRVIAEAAPSGDPAAAVIETEVAGGRHAWLAARCRGSRLLPQHSAPQRVFAHTSPVYLTAPQERPPADPAPVKRFLGHLDRMLEWVAREARCPTDKHRAALAEVFTAARAELRRRLG